MKEKWALNLLKELKRLLPNVEAHYILADVITWGKEPRTEPSLKVCLNDNGNKREHGIQSFDYEENPEDLAVFIMMLFNADKKDRLAPCCKENGYVFIWDKTRTC